MGRKKLITDETMMAQLSDYVAQNPGVKVKASNFGQFLRARGINVQDYVIRRNKVFRDMCEKLYPDDTETHPVIVAYATMDVDDFLQKHQSRQSIVDALQKRDSYYAEIASVANVAIESRKKIEKQVSYYKKKAEELEEKSRNYEKQISSMRERLSDYNALRSEVKRLREYIKKTVRPEIALHILNDCTNVADSILDENYEVDVIDVDTDISVFNSKAVAKLFMSMED